jgi:hypothetical protein
MKKLNVLVVCLLVLFSCKNNELDVQPDNRKPQKIETNQVTKRDFAIVDGFVRTSENHPLGNVTVKNGTEIIGRSDADGYIRLTGAPVEEGDVLSFEHKGFITVSKVISADTKLIIWMKERAESVIVDSKSGGTVRLERGGELRIPANAFTSEGKTYTGPVEITASYVDVTNRDEVRSAPGSYIAFDAGTNSLTPLNSYGMVEVTAVIPEVNQPVELRRDRPIQATLPILTADSPSRVNLYELDRESGYWTLTGVLNNFQNTLQGEITTVNSTWNADDPCSEALVCVKVKVIFQNGNPGCGVGATGLTYQGFDGIHTIGPDDYVELMVCPDSVFELGACWIFCCGPGVPPSDPCCNNPQHRTNIDLSTVTMNPNGCTDLGTWVINN